MISCSLDVMVMWDSFPTPFFQVQGQKSPPLSNVGVQTHMYRRGARSASSQGKTCFVFMEKPAVVTKRVVFEMEDNCSS